MTILDQVVDNYRDEGELRVDTKRQGLTVIIGVALGLLGYFLPVANTNDKIVVMALIIVAGLLVIGGIISLIENILEATAKLILLKPSTQYAVSSSPSNPENPAIEDIPKPILPEYSSTYRHGFDRVAMANASEASLKVKIDLARRILDTTIENSKAAEELLTTKIEENLETAYNALSTIEATQNSGTDHKLEPDKVGEVLACFDALEASIQSNQFIVDKTYQMANKVMKVG